MGALGASGAVTTMHLKSEAVNTVEHKHEQNTKMAPSREEEAMLKFNEDNWKLERFANKLINHHVKKIDMYKFERQIPLLPVLDSIRKWSAEFQDQSMHVFIVGDGYERYHDQNQPINYDTHQIMVPNDDKQWIEIKADNDQIGARHLYYHRMIGHHPILRRYVSCWKCNKQIDRAHHHFHPLPLADRLPSNVHMSLISCHICASHSKTIVPTFACP